MTIGYYRIIRTLGKGGMSEVYEVENSRLGSRHALKLFTYEKDEPEVRERFLVEGRLLARLSHPRIVRVTDIGTDEASGRPYFVMDLIQDERGVVRSLADIEPGTADEETIGRWYDDIREGLAYIHANGVIHRDLKLQNILIGPDGHAVLMDFGISKIVDAKGGGAKVVDVANTIVKMREGHSLVMGSIGYMAPELEMGVAASPQSDWYALGVIVYRLLTGTWCDARTDVVGTLETYDPVWKRIIPKLLHSNPQGRECLSYADETRADREKAELAAEERWLKEKSRGHVARHAARWLGAALLGLAVVFAFMAFKYNADRKLWRAESRFSGVYRSPYDFDELFKIPAEAQAEAQEDESGNLIMPARDDLAASRIDLLVVTHDVFEGLNAGNVTVEKAIADLVRLQEQFEADADDSFDAWPEGYMQVGSDEATFWLLSKAVERLRELAEK